MQCSAKSVPMHNINQSRFHFKGTEKCGGKMFSRGVNSLLSGWSTWIKSDWAIEVYRCSIRWRAILEGSWMAVVGGVTVEGAPRSLPPPPAAATRVEAAVVASWGHRCCAVVSGFIRKVKTMHHNSSNTRKDFLFLDSKGGYDRLTGSSLRTTNPGDLFKVL